MRLILIPFLFVISGFLYGQGKIYTTYKTEGGMGIQLTYDNLPQNEIQTRVTSQEYEFVDWIFLPAKTRGIAKKHIRFRKDGKMGILNAKGKEVIPAMYDTIQSCVRFVGEVSPGIYDFFIVQKEDQVWVLNYSNLKPLFPETYDNVEYSFVTGDLICHKNDRTRYYCNNGKELFKTIEFESIHDVLSESGPFEYSAPLKIIAKEPGKPMSVYSEEKSFNNREGAHLHRFIGERQDYSVNILIAASKNGKMGLLDELGNIRVPFLYDSVMPIYPSSNNTRMNRLVIVSDGKEGLCDFYGNILFPAEYMRGSFSQNEMYYSSALFRVQKDTMSIQGVVSALGTEIIPLQEQVIEELIHNGYYDQNYFYVTRDEKKGVYNFDGIEIIPCEYYDIFDSNSVNNSGKTPDFIPFKTQQEYHDYWGN